MNKMYFPTVQLYHLNMLAIGPSLTPTPHQIGNNHYYEHELHFLLCTGLLSYLFPADPRLSPYQSQSQFVFWEPLVVDGPPPPLTDLHL
jgi:hypothetical protein